MAAHAVPHVRHTRIMPATVFSYASTAFDDTSSFSLELKNFLRESQYSNLIFSHSMEPVEGYSFEHYTILFTLGSTMHANLSGVP